MADRLENASYRFTYSADGVDDLVFFYTGVVFNLTHAVVALLIVLVISFLFTTVAANATAIVGTNPVPA